MKITLKNVGTLKEAVIEPARLTVFCGGNNTGKTYAMYVVWALLQRRIHHAFAVAERMAEDIKVSGSAVYPLHAFIKQNWATLEKGIAEGLRKRLPDLFSAPPTMFEPADIRLDLGSDALIQWLEKNADDFRRSISLGGEGSLDVRLTSGPDGLGMAWTAVNLNKSPTSLLAEIISSLLIELSLVSALPGKAFLLPAERGGLNLFYPDLDAKNSALVRHLKRDDSNPFELMKDLMVAQYAEPIDAYIQFLKRVPRIPKNGSDYHDQALQLQKDITRVRYKVSKDGVITAKPYRSETELGIHLTSSTVKSFYGLWAWLELQAHPGDCLMIDEPELNLHPDNQRLIARLLVRLVNRGIRVVVSTHSDYIVRELNNMTMLASDFPERVDVEKRFDYDAEGAERLQPQDVVAYNFTDKIVRKVEVSREFGIEVESMDAAINRLNESNSAIYFALQDALHPVTTPDSVKAEEDA